MRSSIPFATQLPTTLLLLLVGAESLTQDPMTSVRATDIGELTVRSTVTVLPQAILPCALDDTLDPEGKCEPDRPTRELNPDLYAQQKAECECDILISVCLLDDTYQDVIKEVNTEGEVVRILTITTCHYRGCRTKVKLLDIDIPS